MANAFVGDHDAAFRPDQLDITEAEAENVVQPDRVADDLSWKPMSRIRGGFGYHGVSLAYLPLNHQPPLTCQCLKEGSKLLLIDRILPERIDSNDALTRGRFITDINMFLNPGGRERTEAELRDLLGRAGLRLTRVMPMPSPQAVTEVEPE